MAKNKVKRAKKEDKVKAILNYVSNHMDSGIKSVESPTKFFRRFNMNPNPSGRDFLDEVDAVVESGLRTLRNKKGIVIGVYKEDSDNSDIKRDILDLKKNNIIVDKELGSIKKLLQKRK